jgi:hypothetical protein
LDEMSLDEMSLDEMSFYFTASAGKPVLNIRSFR